MAGTKITLTRQDLEDLGREMVKCVVEEARKDLVKQNKRPTPQGQPEGLPTSESFFESFGYRIKGASTVEITSTWPWVEAHIEGRPSYFMRWLTRSNGVHRVPMVQSNGTVLVRTAPLTTANAWIHPGFARHTFLARGIKRGREYAAKMVTQKALEMLRQGDPL